MNIIRHTPEKVELYLNDEHIDILHNDIELAHVQIQIAKDELEGYSISWNGEIIKINSKGELSKWPKGMYDETQKLYGRLHKIRTGILKTSAEWEEEVPKEYELIIQDPDGWDRQNFEFSFNKELITKDEFKNRVSLSTIWCVDFSKINIW